DIEMLSSPVYGNKTNGVFAHNSKTGLILDVLKAVDCERPSANFIILSKELKHVSHHIDKDSQRARHCLAMLRCSVVHLEIFINDGWENNPKMINISTSRVALNLLATVFKEHPNDELRSIATT
ncbi:4878_t:CDS:2, partial [Cetraspora pellucida]